MSCTPDFWRGPVAVAFRLLMLAALWPGPIVWGHQHEGAPSGLTEHLESFHEGDAQTPCSDWHWHVSVPGPFGPMSSDDDHTDDTSDGCSYCPLAESARLDVILGVWLIVHASSMNALPWLPPASARRDGCAARALWCGRSSQVLLCRMSC